MTGSKALTEHLSQLAPQAQHDFKLGKYSPPVSVLSHVQALNVDLYQNRQVVDAPCFITILK